jgi:hypothetical protein
MIFLFTRAISASVFNPVNPFTIAMQLHIAYWKLQNEKFAASNYAICNNAIVRMAEREGNEDPKKK